jgi:hypothetical protein
LDNRYSAASAGTTAEAENQSAIAATWQIAISVTEPSFESAQGNRMRAPVYP